MSDPSSQLKKRAINSVSFSVLCRDARNETGQQRNSDAQQ